MNYNNLSELNGTSITEFISSWPTYFKDIVEFRFTSYEPSKSLSQLMNEHTITLQNNSLINTVKKENTKKYLKLIIKKSNEQINNKEPRAHIAIQANSLNIDCLSEIISKIPSNEVFAVTSKCFLKNQKLRHIPMIDLAIHPDKTNLNLLIKNLRNIHNSHGVIASTGRSYHCYWMDLLSHSQWRKFMATSLLYQSIVDIRYIGHRLLGNKCILRIGSHVLKPEVPKIVAVF